MTVILSSSGDFVREVALKSIAALDQTYQLEFSSRLATAKNPLESKKNFDLILSADDLRVLKRLIDDVLSS